MNLKRMFSSVAAVLLTRRSPLWPAARRQHLHDEPTCQWCGGAVDLEVHHIDPVHHAPEKELVQANMITLCMAKDQECHYMQGHRGESWLAWDPDIRKKCEQRRAAS